MQPTWLAHVLAITMLATTFYCVARLVVARRWQRSLHYDTNVAHAADGLAMAGMLLASLQTLPDGAWEVIFGTFTFWFALRGTRFVLRNGLGTMEGEHAHTLTHYVSHLTMAGAMLYMFVEASPTTVRTPSPTMAMGAGGTSNLTALTLLLLVVLFASAVWHGDSLSRYATAAGPRPGDGPGAALAGAGGPAATLGELGVGQPPLAPRLEMVCHMVLCIVMGYMLILML
jgi:hypothetical protein